MGKNFGLFHSTEEFTWTKTMNPLIMLEFRTVQRATRGKGAWWVGAPLFGTLRYSVELIFVCR